MALRPIDMTIVLQNTPEATNRTQSNELHHPEVAQQFFSDRLNKETRMRDTTVIQTNKTEENRVDKDGKNHAGGYSSPKKKQGKKETKAGAARAGGSMLDISV